MKIREYVKEIKIRGVYILISAITTMLCTYENWWEILEILATPLENAQNLSLNTSINNIKSIDNIDNTPVRKEPFHFIITEITEAFFAATHFSFFLSIYITIPLLFYQFWLFIKPGLYEYEKSVWKRYYGWYCILATLNIIITYWIILPGICKMFLNIDMVLEQNNNIIENVTQGVRNGVRNGGIEINLEAKIDKYVNLVEKTLIIGNILLQIPTFIGTIIYLSSSNEDNNAPAKIINLQEKITKGRGLWYILALIISGIIAPPDIISQIIIGIPIIIIYEITIYIICINLWKRTYTFKSNITS